MKNQPSLTPALTPAQPSARRPHLPGRPPPSTLCLLASVLCLLTAPHARAATTVVSTTIISGTDDIGPLSGVTFSGVSGTIEVVSGTSLVFDSAGVSSATPANRLTITSGNAAAFYLEASSTMTFTRNVLSTGNGGAITNAGSGLTLNAAPGSWYVISSNTATAGGGGAIANTAASANLALNNVIFKNNYAGAAAATNAGGGGAIFNNVAGVTISLTNALFQSNSAAGGGGAIADPNNGTTLTLNITSGTFLNNISNAASADNIGGGVIYVVGANSILNITDVTFQGNYAVSSGGAIKFQTPTATNPITGNFTNVLFISNTAGRDGGAVNTFNSRATIFKFNNTSFLDNHANGNGGALFITSTAIFHVDAAASATMAGNSAGAGAGVSNGIYMPNLGNTNNRLNVDTDAGGRFDMLDPIVTSLGGTNTLLVEKTGDGTWNLGGANNLLVNNTVNVSINFNVTAGKLHLYRAAEGPYNGSATPYTAAAGAITLASNITTSTFSLAASATLSAGGGNTVAAPTISLAKNSTLEFDLNYFATNPATSPILTLNATTSLNPNAWQQNINLLGATTPGLLTDHTTYNLLTLTGATFATGANDAFTLLGGLDPLLYHLQLNSTNTTLQLFYGLLANNVLSWTGNAGDGSWIGNNWALTSNPAANTAFAKGDIINLDLAATTSTTITANTNALLAALYVSGNASYTITGTNTLTTTATAGTLSGSAAATGQLVLGAAALPDASGTTITPYTGTLTLANTANTFENGINITTGVLVGNATNLKVGGASSSPSAAITIAPTGTLIISQTTAATYTSPITGAGALIKTATAALTLAADNSTFTGATDIRAGLLLLAPNAKLGGALHVAPAATLGGANGATAGSPGKTTALDSGATLQIGLDPTPAQTFALAGNLTLADGSLLNYASITDSLLVGGNVTFAGTGTFTLATLDIGTYALINSAALTANTSLLSIYYSGSLFDPSHYTWSINSGTLLLDISSITLAANNVLTWTNATANAAWLASANWNLTGMSLATPFAQGDIANLSGSGLPAGATTGTITLATTATASAIYLSGTASYAITDAPGAPGALVTATGVGILSGSAAATGKLVLGKTAPNATTVNAAAFTGTLDLTGLTGTNAFTEGIEINTGALRVATTDQLGTTLSKLTFTGTADAGASGTLIAAGNLAFDSAAVAGGTGTANRLLIPANIGAAFIVEDGHTLTFSNNTITTQGAAINLGGTSSLLIQAGAGSQVTFSGNSTTNTNADAGALYIGQSATLTLTGGASFLFTNNTQAANANRAGAIFANTGAVLNLDNVTFSYNKTGTGNGGALFALSSARVNLTNVLFTSNTAGNTGGALFDNTASIITVTNGTFQNNLAGNGGAAGVQGGALISMTNVLFTQNTSTNSGGGAISVGSANSSILITDGTFSANHANASGGAAAYISAPTGTLSFTRALFTANTAGDSGGAIYATTSGTAELDLTDVLFRSNTATNNGGAIATGNAAASAATGMKWNLTNASFLDNTAGALGGAIYLGGTTTLNYTVTTSATIAGNTAAGASSGIYISNIGSPTLNFNISTGAHLDMLDPMFARTGTNTALAITQTGGGLWNLGGANTFTANSGTPSAVNMNFTVSTGTLHLYRQGEVTYNGAPVAAGAITITNTSVAGAITGTFTLGPAATLSAGGGNSITAPVITIAPTATLALDLAAATTGAGSVLTLSATTFNINNWSQTLTLLNLDTLAPNAANYDTFNLITLAGPGATGSNLFTPASFGNLATLNATLLNGFTLQLNSDNTILQLYYYNASFTNNVLTWTGSASNLWRGNNWFTPTGTATTYTKGDIVNLTGADAALSASATISVDPAAGVTIAAIYLSGPQNYTITDNPIITSATAGTLAGAAATGQLVLGATAAADATTIDPAPFTGTLTLLNTSNTFTGGIDIRTGALLGNAANLNTGPAATAATVNIHSGASLTFNQLTTATYSSPIAGAGLLAKQGSATLTLAANSSAFTGTTNIDAGKLTLAPASALGGRININTGATLAGSAAAAGNVTINNAAHLQVGDPAAPALAPITLASLTLNPGSILDYASFTNTLLISGNASLLGPATINLAGNGIAATSYTLLTASALNNGLGGAFDTSLLSVYYNGTLFKPGDYTLNITGGSLLFNVINIPVALNNVMTWTGAADNLWLPSANWLIPSLNVTKAFAQGDVANLTGNAPGTIRLNLVNTATAAAIYVSGTNSYSITGGIALVTASDAGALTGPAASGKLALGKYAADIATVNTAAFTGTLDLAQTGENHFSSIDIDSGALRVTTNAQLGAPLNKINFTGTTGALIAGGNLRFDGAGSANSLAIATGRAATLIVENSATITFTNNVATGNGGAINNVAGSLTLAPSDTTSTRTAFVFTSNTAFADATGTAGGNGGAIANTGTNAASLITISNATFSNNYAAGSINGSQNGGGAIYNSVASATITLNNVTFSNNYSAATGLASTSNDGTRNGGGAIYNTGANATIIINGMLAVSNTSLLAGGAIANGGASGFTMLVTSATFLNNTSLVAFNNNAGGGAFYTPSTGGNFTFTDVLFQGNLSTANAGAVKLQFPTSSNTINATFTRVLFLSNTAGLGGTGDGGALQTYNTVTGHNSIFNDVSFLNNYAATNGGAISYSGNVTFNVLTTATMAGNRAGGTGNGIYIQAFGQPTLTVNTDDAARFDMLDPFVGTNVATTITKTGPGVWALGGNNTLGTAANNFAVNAGTLFLYRGGETIGAYTATTGNLALGAAGSFNVAKGATLFAGGGNTITANTIIFAPDAFLAFSLADAVANAPTSQLTLNASTLSTTLWSQTINLYDVNTLLPGAGDYYNLITLTGASSGGLFTFSSFGLLSNVTGLPDDNYSLEISPDGKTLMLVYGAANLANQVITWTGLTGTSWRGMNWIAAGAPKGFARGDIANLATLVDGTTALPVATTTIAIDTTTSATLAGVYLSGPTSYTLTGSSIITNAAAGTLAGKPAATGQLILGARARDDASAVDTTPFTGTLTLLNTSNTFTAGIDIRSGALVGNAASLSTGTGNAPVTIATAASLTFDQPTAATYTAPIAGSGLLVKTNTAALTLSANSSAFAGTTNILAGKLLVGASLATPAASLGGSVHVAAGATFGGSGTAATVALDPASTLQIGTSTGTAAANQTLTLSTLALSGPATLDYLRIDDTLLLTGALTQATPSATTLLNLNTISTGSFSLVTAGGAITGLTNANLAVSFRGNLLDPADYLLNATTSQIWLTFTELPNNVITWNGAAADTLWLASKNWQITGGPATPRPFKQGDIVNLSGADSPSALQPFSPLTLSANALTAALYLSGSTSYAITGPGAITTDSTAGVLAGTPAATGKLTLGKTAAPDATVTLAAFTGTLDLTGQTGTVANNFAQGIEINSGALRVSTTNQLGATLNKIAFTVPTVTISNTITTVTINEDGIPEYTYDVTSHLNAASTGVINIAGNLTLDSANAINTNRLTVTASTAADFYVEDGASLTITRAIAATAGANGGAINVAASSMLRLAGGPNSQYLFISNSTNPSGQNTNYDGGAIYLNNNAEAFLGAASVLVSTGSYKTLADAVATLDAAGLAPADAGPTLAFTSNFARNRGGAIFVSTNGALYLDNATFSSNRTTNGNGGAIGAIQSAHLELAGVLFVSNSAISAGSYGGAVFNNTKSVTLIQSATFDSNYAGNGGGALAIQGGASITVNGALFTANSSGTLGGAIYIASGSSSATAIDATFINNASRNGGAISITDPNTVLSVTNAVFQNNTATNIGGAVYIASATGAILNFTNVLFINNTSGTIGGAIGVNNVTASNCPYGVNLTDVSFLGNTGPTNGGAFGVYGSAFITYNVLTSATIAGNRGAGAPNSFYFYNAGSPSLIVNVTNGANLDMLDPLKARLANNQTLGVIKAGEGLWNLAGTQDLTTNAAGNNATINFAINAGMLHLYAAGETSYNAVPVPAGNIYISRFSGTTGALTGGFSIGKSGTLSAGGGPGGNTITAPSVVISTSAAFILDAAAATPNNDTASILTFVSNTVSAKDWSQTLQILNADTLTPYNGYTYDLIYLKGAAYPDRFFDTSFNYFATITGIPDHYQIQTTPDHTALQLYYFTGNYVINWTGADTTNNWRAPNWQTAGVAGGTTGFAKGDIINLASTPAGASAITTNLNAATTAAAIFVSGTTNYTITGSTLATDPAGSTLAATPAATGKLTLGAKANDDATIATAPFTGTLTLLNSDALFTNGIDILSGALVGNAANLATTRDWDTQATPAPVTIAQGASLTINQTVTDTYATPLAGSGALNKTGNATLYLLADSSAFAGNTTITAGSLLLGSAPVPGAGSGVPPEPSAAALGGNITVAKGVTGFGGAGTATGNVTLAVANAILQVGSPAPAPAYYAPTPPPATALAINGSLTLAPGSILNYTSINNSLHVGTLSFTGSTYIDIPDFWTSGTYDLGNLASLYNNALLTLNGTPAPADGRKQASLSTSGPDLILTTFRDISRVMTWTGATNNAWALTGADWTTASGTTKTFGVGDVVIFDDSQNTTRPAINIAASGAIVSAMLVDGTTNYTITGGPITADSRSLAPGDPAATALATGKLTKTGPSTLIINTTGVNTFMGGIDINEGSLNLASTATTTNVNVASDSRLRLADGYLISATTTFADSSTFSGYGTIEITTGVPVTALLATNGTFNGSLGYTTGTSHLYASGTGNMTLNGMVDVNVTSGNTLVIYADSDWGVWYLPNNTTFLMSSSTIFGNTVTGPGAYHKTSEGTLRIVGVGALGNTGTTIIDQGTVELYHEYSYDYGAAFLLKNNMMLNGGTLALNYGAFVTNTSGVLIKGGGVADWTGVQIIAGDNAANSTITGYNDTVHLGHNAFTWNPDDATSGTFLPRLSGGLYVALDPGAGNTVVLGNPANDFAASVIVNSGTLQLSNPAQIGGFTPGANFVASKIALGGGALELTSNLGNLNIPSPLEVREGNSTLALDPGVSCTLSGIVTNTTFTPSNAIAALTKIGAGTVTITGAMQATALTISEGLWIAPASNLAGPPNNGFVTINPGATMRLGLTSTTGATASFGMAAGLTYTTTPGGVIRAGFVGGGTLDITTGKLAFTSETTDIARINVTGPNTAIAALGANFAPSTSSTITIDQGLLALSGNKQQLGNIVLRNSANLAFLWSPQTSTTAVLSGTTYTYYNQPSGDVTIPSLTASGTGISKLWFNANISTGKSDHLTIDGRIAGRFDVNVYNDARQSLAPDAAVNIELIRAPAAYLNANPFAPDAATVKIYVIDSLDNGLWSYDVTGTTTNGYANGYGTYTLNIVGKGRMSKSAAAMNAAAAAFPIAWFSELDSLVQRLGDLHLDTRETKAGFAAWTRGYAQKLNFNTRLTGSKFSERQLGGEAGLDYKFGGERKLYLGAFAGYGQGQRDYSNSTDASNQSVYGGLYATYVTPAGWFADLALKYNRFRSRFATTDPSSFQSAAADFHNNALGASLELGKRQNITFEGNPLWFITPSLQIARTNINASDYTTTNGITIAQASGSVSRARAGFQFGHDMETQKNGTISIYLKGYYGWQWTNDGALTITVPDGSPAVRFASKINGFNLTAGAGFAWQFTKATQFYLDYELTQADYYLRPYALNAGLRHTW